MDLKHKDMVHRLNCLANDRDALYHRSSLKLGVSDSVSMVLYMIYEKGDGCLLYDIWSESYISKQTVNSAVRKLESNGVLYLEHDKGRAKLVYLTEKGREYMKETAVKIFEAECRAYDGWTEEEIETYLRLTEKYNDSFRAEVDKLEGRKA